VIDWERLDSAGRLGAHVDWWRRDAEQVFREMLPTSEGKVPSDEDLRLFTQIYSAGLELIEERDEHIVAASLYRFRGSLMLNVPSRIPEDGKLLQGVPTASLNGLSPRDGMTPAHVIYVTITSPNEASIRSFADTTLSSAGTPTIAPRVAPEIMQETIWGDRKAFCVAWRLKLARPSRKR
jgi:hypothetical protein